MVRTERRGPGCCVLSALATLAAACVQVQPPLPTAALAVDDDGAQM
jgi:hypothetical protein